MGRARTSEPDPATFAGRVALNVRRLREKLKIKAAEAAEQTGMPVVTWYSIEAGQNPDTTGRRFDELVAFLGCKIEDLTKPPKD